MTPKVLILAGLYDFSADLVVAQLDEKAVPFLRLNREELADYRLSLDPLLATLSVRHGDGETNLDAQNLRAIWYRQPVFLRNSPSDPLSISEQLARSQWVAFLRSLILFDHVAWMNNPQATYGAECKPYQLSVARRCGFQVPHTIVTNDANAVQNSFPGRLVIKSLDTVLLLEGGDCLFTYTTITSNNLLTDANTGAAPLIAQHALEQKTDIRVTVVGEEVFATRILVHGAGVDGDWRVVPRDDLTYEDICLDSSIKDHCLELMRHLGLSFAAIDLIEAKDGIYFIEVNPTGEWGWLNGPSRRIDRAIAHWLSNA
jgi:glutathione synthase/RimK-type ligase-like ATP-grasp enzyme